jgi:hypothetical protein
MRGSGSFINHREVVVTGRESSRADVLLQLGNQWCQKPMLASNVRGKKPGGGHGLLGMYA